MSTTPDLDAARRSHVLEYLGQHPAGASAREIHAAAVESGEAAVLGWEERFPLSALRVLEALYSAGEVAAVARPMGKPTDPTPALLDWPYTIAQLALL
jgi:hypothetical protein